MRRCADLLVFWHLRMRICMCMCICICEVGLSAAGAVTCPTTSSRARYRPRWASFTTCTRCASRARGHARAGWRAVYARHAAPPRPPPPPPRARDQSHQIVQRPHAMPSNVSSNFFNGSISDLLVWKEINTMCARWPAVMRECITVSACWLSARCACAGCARGAARAVAVWVRR